MCPGSYLSSGLAKTPEKKLHIQRIKDYLKNATTEKKFCTRTKPEEVNRYHKTIKKQQKCRSF